MKRIAAVFFLFAICLSLYGCDRQIMWREQETTASASFAFPSSSTPAKPEWEELSAGKVMIKGCLIDVGPISCVVNRFGKTQNVCQVRVFFTNQSDKTCTLDSLCQIRVKQNGKICSIYHIEEFEDTPDGDEDVAPGKTLMPQKIYAVKNLEDPVQVQIIYKGMVISEVTHDPKNPFES
jgi:hypothetical protein